MTSLPTGLDLSKEFDGLFFGTLVATALLGITVVQAWIYINNNNDGWLQRGFVS
ncbi:hypothetical protein VKT23_007752 [Stygiomarasmius scandens]|uniref:Uncharacterized protein n=1 Tax=Marasmiellus scandens TaxID=2682957 RepID=A0ABR1JIB2_9AGAR